MHHITAVLRAFLCCFMLIYINDVVFCCRWPQCPSAPGSWSWRRKWLIFSFRWELWEPRPPDPLHLHYRTRRSLQFYSLMWISHSRDYFSLKNVRNKCVCNKKKPGRTNCVQSSEKFPGYYNVFLSLWGIMFCLRRILPLQVWFPIDLLKVI